MPSGTCTRLRDLVGGEAAPVGEDDRLALRLGQLAERLADLGAFLVALGEDAGCSSTRGSSAAVDELQPVGGAAAHLALAPQVERARAAHQAQVGAEIAARGVERVRTPPQAQEHVLHDVLGHASRR